MKRQTGFTMIELLVTMVVAVILTVMAVPGFKTSFQNNRLVTQANDLLGALLMARATAVASGNSLNAYVTVCASSDGATCLAAANATGWASGWIVCQEPANSATTSCTGATVLRVYPALSGNNTLNGNGFGARIQFQKNGTTTLAASGYFSLCDSRGTNYGRAIYLGVSGETKVSTNPGKLLNGASMTCP